MTDPFHDEPGYLTELPEDLKLKRAATARRRRWRRRLALGSLVAVVGAVVALVASGLGGGGSDETQPEAKQAGPKPAKPRERRPRVPRRLEATSGTGPDPRVPRDRHARRHRLLPGAVRLTSGLQGPDAVAQRPRVRGGDARPGRGRLVRARRAAHQADRRQLRRRLPEPVCERLPGAASSSTGRACSTCGRRAPTCRTRTCGRCSTRGWELASHTITHADLTTVDSTTLEQRGGRLTPDPAAALRGSGGQLLLSVGPLRRPR